jgi:hypothetical protein
MTKSRETVETAAPRIVLLSCQVLEDLLVDLMPDGLVDDVKYMDYGLHRVPTSMTPALQEVLDALEEPSLVVLGYGLCGNGIRGLQAGSHTLLVPRVDDCIAILIGSRSAYMREFEKQPGTYWLSKGWLESGSHPLKEYEEYVPRWGEDQAMWIMDQQYQHYKRLVLVAHSQQDLDAYRAEARKVAGFCDRWGMEYGELLGTDAYLRRLVELVQMVAQGTKRMLDPNGGDGWERFNQTAQSAGFLVIPPGGEIRQDDFI